MQSVGKPVKVSERPLPEPTRERLGPYRLCLKLAAGGMATVYLARADANIGRNRMVALKVVHPHLANDREFVQMFMDEADIASRIHHTNVCTVYDYDVDSGNYYLVMEFLAGKSMDSIWRKTSRTPPADVTRHAKLVARALAGACEGLHAAHELTDAEGEPLDVIHRDVSPENIFLTFEGVAKVVDFGIASAARKRHRTRTGIIKGKFAYVAPEFLSSEAKPDRRVDLWGIGVILWELVTGRRLFHRDTDFDTLRAVNDAQVEPPSRVRPELPAELDEIVMRALQANVADRYSTARELGKSLSRFAATGDDPIDDSDLAEWMKELYPGGAERSQQLLGFADQVDQSTLGASWPDSGVPSSIRPPPPDSFSSVPPTATSLPPPQADQGELSTEWMMPTTLWPPRAAEPQPAHRPPSGRWRIPGALLIGLFIGATGVAVLDGGLTSLLNAGPAPVAASQPAAPRGAASPLPHSEPPVVVDHGGGSTTLVRGHYVVDIAESSVGEVVLKVRTLTPEARETLGRGEEAPLDAQPGAPAASQRAAATPGLVRPSSGQRRGARSPGNGFDPGGI